MRATYWIIRYGQDGMSTSVSADFQEALSRLAEATGLSQDPKRVRQALALSGGLYAQADGAGSVYVMVRERLTPKKTKGPGAKDARCRAYSATVRVVRVYSTTQKLVTKTNLSDIAGLFELLSVEAFRVALTAIGDEPCVYSSFAEQEIKHRLPGIRANLAKAKAEGKETITVIFPKTKENEGLEVMKTPVGEFWIGVDIQV